jgi:hypothetical protein
MRNTLNPSEFREAVEPLFKDVELIHRIYCDGRTALANSLTIDRSLEIVCRKCLSIYPNFKVPTFVERAVPSIDSNKEGPKIVAFSGGKVSLACALRLKDKGEDVILVHVKNSEDSDDGRVRCETLAKKINLPIIVLPIDYPKFDDSPVKYMLMLNHLLEYAVDNGCQTNIIFGTFDGASILYNSINEWPNCVEFMDAYKNLIRHAMFEFNVACPMPSYNIVWDELLKHKNFIHYISSDNDVDEMMLYIAKVDHNLLEEIDTSIYMKYINKLKNRFQDDTGMSLTAVSMWNRFFFYRIEKSKHYQELMKLS